MGRKARAKINRRGRATRQGAQTVAVNSDRPPDCPRWEGVYSFRRVWEACWSNVVDTPIVMSDDGGIEYESAVMLAALMSMKALTAAHPIYIGEDQLHALPDEGIDPDYLRDLHLPYPAIYFDFATARGPARVPIKYAFFQNSVEAREALVTGALVVDYDQSVATPANVKIPDGIPRGTPTSMASGLTIMPMGCGIDIDGVIRTPNRGDGLGLDDYAPMGYVSFGYTPDEPELIIGATPEVGGMGSVVVRYPLHRIHPALPGFAVVGTTAALTRLIPDVAEEEGAISVEGISRLDEDEFTRHFHGEATLVWKLAMQAIKCLYLIEAANVVVEDAPVSRQVRRDVERRGGKIASTVRITRTSKKPPKQPTGEERTYSHRFPRRGHYAHYTHGPLAKPDHIAPCSRRDPKTGELTCPDGCRRVWHPATVVGPEGLPYVPKTYVWPGKDKLMRDSAA